MPIYDQSYRPYRGAFSSHAMRWWTITRTGVLHHLRSRKFLVFVTLTFIPPIVFGFMIYAAHQFPEQSLVKVNAELFRRLMEIQMLWFIVLGIYPGTGLIANDLKWNAIQLYLSKPSPGSTTWWEARDPGDVPPRCDAPAGAPPVHPGAGFSSDLKFLSSYWWLPWAGGLLGDGDAGVGLIVLGLSSLSKNSRYVGIMLIALTLFSGGFANFLRAVFGQDSLIVLSPIDDLKQISYLFFGGVSEDGSHVIGAVIVLALLAGAGRCS